MQKNVTNLSKSVQMLVNPDDVDILARSQRDLELGFLSIEPTKEKKGL